MALSCFVIIGYGKKTSYASGKIRQLDLDETYNLLIKPVFDQLTIPCYRAIDKNLNGSIDNLMLEEIKNAALVVADISTLNANVMWELGVRHALKPCRTIVICEEEQIMSIPFDINHFIIHKYTHSEQGIPYKTVDGFRKQLTDIVQALILQDPCKNDSPVFEFLKELENSPAIKPLNENDATESLASILEKGEEAKNNKDFNTALTLYITAETFAKQSMALKDNLPLIICRQALCTYKLNPKDKQTLIKAKEILDQLNPQQSSDLEVVAQNGSINKRLFDITGDIGYLESAIQSYEKGFQLRQDYYNGINTAFMLYKKAALLKSKNEEWEDVKLKADYIRNTVLENCLKLENEKSFDQSRDAIWVLLTIAEAYHYKSNLEKKKEYEDKAQIMADKKKDAFSIAAYLDQEEKIRSIFQNFK